MRDAYIRLHELGYAHSVEAWREETLAGGLYGVSLGARHIPRSEFVRIVRRGLTASTLQGNWGEMERFRG